jgi:hypothetical protein
VDWSVNQFKYGGLASFNPLMPVTISLDRFCSNFQGMFKMVKKEFHFFVLFLK